MAPRDTKTRTSADETTTMADENFRTTLPKSQNIVQLQVKNIVVPEELRKSRADALSSLETSLKNGSIADMDSNLAILYSTLKADGIFVPIRVYQPPKSSTTSYTLSEGLLRLEIFKKLYPTNRIPAIIEPYDKDILHRAFIGNMAREDYTLPELAQWINYLKKDNKENDYSIHVKYHIPRSRIACALFSTSEKYKDLLSRYPETAITVLERINTALKPEGEYMQNTTARSFILDHLRGQEGARVSKGFLDSLLYDAMELIRVSGGTADRATVDTNTTPADASSAYKRESTPATFYRELTLEPAFYEELSNRIQSALKNKIVQPDDISITIRIKKQALAALTNKEVDEVKSLDIEDWLK